jgi:hypothetical protein
LHVSWAGDVAFTDPARLVEIALPEAEIVVSVRANGEPVRNVAVAGRMLRDGAGGLQPLDVEATTGAGGEARLSGMLPGSWMISVFDETRKASARKRVVLADAKPARVELELVPAETISGTVREAYGAPVAGARVLCIVPVAEGPAQAAVVSSADDGTFELGSAGAARSTIPCSVTSYAGADAFRIAGGSPAVFALPARPASVQVLGLPPLPRKASLWLTSEDGRGIDVSPYLRSDESTASLVIPAVAPGRWRLVRAGSVAEWLMLTTGAARMLPAIAVIALEPGEQRTIDLRKQE